METFMHQVLSGLATGGIYASIALALVMIYQATHLVNFAQGEMAMFSTYIAWSLIESGLPYWGAFAATVIISFVMGVAIERAIIRPIGSRSELAVVVVFIALLVIFNSVAGWIWTYSLKTFPTPFSTAVIPSSKYLSTPRSARC
jgi:branched-chain amino acid transport system permease protein